MFMSWIFLILISIFSISFANIFQKLSMKKEESDPVVSSIFFQFLIALFIFIFALFNGFQFPSITLFFPFFLISTILYGLGTLCFFTSIKLIEASEMTILSGFGSITTIITAYIFINERLKFLQLIGVFFIILSVVIIGYRKGKLIFNKGIIYALLGTVFYGCAITNDTFIIHSYDAVSYVTIMAFLPGVFLSLIYPKRFYKSIKNFKKYINKDLLIYSFFYSIQAITYFLAIQKGAMASQVNSIYKSEIILTIILSSFLLKEYDNIMKKIIASIFMLIGVIFIV